MLPRFKELFDATSQSTREFLSKPSQGFFVPAYQREYSWDSRNISRLFDDVLYGIRQLRERSNAVSFLGTIITIDESTSGTSYRDPSGRIDIKTIVDGQQRICTVIMCNIALHDSIRRSLKKLKPEEGSHDTWIRDQCSYILSDLAKTYSIDTDVDAYDYRFYPRVIRELHDRWSNKQTEAQYTSPASRLVWEYITHSRNSDYAEFKYGPDVNASPDAKQHDVVRGAFNSVKSVLNNILREKSDFQIALDPSINNYGFFEGIWPSGCSEEVQHSVADYVTSSPSNRQNHRRYRDLLRLMCVARYLNNRIAVTVVSAKNEDDAFDIFEALNTTGAPLTAFETFKPNVIKLEGDGYSTSNSRRWIESTDRYLSTFKRTESRQNATLDMVVPFALAETAKKLPRKLNEQRRYLRDQFDKLHRTEGKDSAREFVRALSNVARFMESAWNAGVAEVFRPLALEDEQAIFAFQLLRDLNHSITIAPMVRFYQNALDVSEYAHPKRGVRDLAMAIKATAAFSVIWRAAKGGTAGIDSHYREIMRDGIEGQSIPPFARRRGGETEVSIENYKKALLTVLEERGEIRSKEEWIRQVAGRSSYDDNATVTRFLLFCALHDSAPDRSDPGLITDGRDRFCQMLSADTWLDDRFSTVEHVAPQSPSEGWADGIYADAHLVHTLGNLTLLPVKENSIASARTWDDKRGIYRLCAARSQTEFQTIRAELEDKGMKLSEGAQSVLGQSAHLVVCESLALVPGPWSVEIIRRRTQRLAARAWAQLFSWLDSE